MKKMHYANIEEALEAANKLLAAYDLPICDYSRGGGYGDGRATDSDGRVLCTFYGSARNGGVLRASHANVGDNGRGAAAGVPRFDWLDSGKWPGCGGGEGAKHD